MVPAAERARTKARRKVDAFSSGGQVTKAELPASRGATIDGAMPLHAVQGARIPEPFSDGLAYFRDQVLPAIRAMKAEGTRSAVVFDIDNTLFDTRWRTLEAAHRYGKKHDIAALANATLDDIGADGADTARRLGLKSKTTIDRFQKFWLDVFWDPKSFALDHRIEQTIALLQEAKDAGAEIFYLTGRIERLRETTEKQIGVLPDGDRAHLICKPRMGIRTERYKAKQLRAGLGQDPPVHIAAFITEGRRDLRHIQRNTEVPALFFDFPIDREGAYTLKRGTPAIPW